MTEAKDTHAITDLADLVLDGYAVEKLVTADGKIDLNDLPAILGIVPRIGPVVAELGEIVPEFKDLSTDESAALVAHIMAKLSLGNDHAARVATEALKFAAQGYSLYKTINEPQAAKA